MQTFRVARQTLWTPLRAQVSPWGENISSSVWLIGRLIFKEGLNPSIFIVYLEPWECTLVAKRAAMHPWIHSSQLCAGLNVWEERIGQLHLMGTLHCTSPVFVWFCLPVMLHGLMLWCFDSQGLHNAISPQIIRCLCRDQWNPPVNTSFVFRWQESC